MLCAHINQEKQTEQSVQEHNENVAVYAKDICCIEELEDMAFLAGSLHDIGKYSDDFQRYIKMAVEKNPSVHRGDVDHASAGGAYVYDEKEKKGLYTEMVQVAIYMHHALYDCLSIENGVCLQQRRLTKEKREKIQYTQVLERFHHDCCKDELSQAFLEADRQAHILKQKILDFQKLNEKERYGNRDFFIGMYERVLLSVLIDADRTDTACFMGNRQETDHISAEESQVFWKRCIDKIEQYLKSERFTPRTRIDTYRNEISAACRDAAYQKKSLYTLSVPTGAGKTLSSLRFALHHAFHSEKQCIFYIAPYNSILEQNANDIEEVLGGQGTILVHHCNVVHDNDDERHTYELLIENWNKKIIATTAVQLLNTFFSSSMASVRRMHSLCNSILIFDEIQALPIRTLELFNLAINFLTRFCKTTVVLCSATQPLLGCLNKNRLMPAVDMTGKRALYEREFKRTTIIDSTEQDGSGLTAERLCGLIERLSDTNQHILVVVNTKECAKTIYMLLREKKLPGKIFHLSTNMCAANREEKLKEIKENLQIDQPLICVSTQLIEAGVNLSFHCVIRSLAGLDNIIQTAGRCNRHAEKKEGMVYIVQLAPELENIEKLKDIKLAQEAMRTVLYQFRRDPQSVDDDLASNKAITLFYKEYFYKRQSEMCYPVSIEGAMTSIVELLSDNPLACRQLRNERRAVKPMLRQAYKTAGECFEVIPEDGKIEVIVEYDEQVKMYIAALDDPYATIKQKKETIKKLQRYTVGISRRLKNQLFSVIYTKCEGSVYVLDESYYSKEYGITGSPENMKDMQY